MRSCPAMRKRNAETSAPAAKTRRLARPSAIAYIRKVSPWIVVWPPSTRRPISANSSPASTHTAATSLHYFPKHERTHTPDIIHISHLQRLKKGQTILAHPPLQQPPRQQNPARTIGYRIHPIPH